MVPACSGGVEAHGAAINQFRRIQLGLAVDLTPETQFGVAPERASKRDDLTSSTLLPIEDTIPMPVMTTRLMV